MSSIKWRHVRNWEVIRLLRLEITCSLSSVIVVRCRTTELLQVILLVAERGDCRISVVGVLLLLRGILLALLM